MTAYDFKRSVELHEEGHTPVSERAAKTEHLPKDRPASETPKTYELVRRASENALYFENSWARGRGWASVFACLILTAPIMLIWVLNTAFRVLLKELANGSSFDAVVSLLFIVAFVAVGIGASTATIRAFRIDLFGPKDVPLVFNRKTRKVYKFIQNMPTRDFSSPKAIVKYWLTAFQPWSMLLIEYDWDCLEAEYFEQTSLQGNVVQTINILQLIVKENPTSDTVIGTISLASPFMVGKEMAYNLWEHIRRYMEEGGPILNPGDQPAPPYPTNLLQSANTMTKGGWVLAAIACWWSVTQVYELGILPAYQAGKSISAFDLLGFFFGDLPGLNHFESLAMVFCLFIADLSLLAVIFNWLAFKWGKDLELPQELQADAGAVLDLKRIAAIANGEAVAESPLETPSPSAFKGSSRKSGKRL